MTKYEIVQEFDIEFLRTMFEEGRLCVIRPQISDPHMYKREVLEYVGRIKNCASDEWKDKVDVLWQRIVESPRFQNKLKMKKGKDAGHMNRYMVTSMVSLMLGVYVYRKGDTLLSLHKKLERTTKKNSIYKNLTSYSLDKEDRKTINELIKRILK